MHLDGVALRGVCCRYASVAVEHRRAAELVHDTYAERGLIARNAAGIHLGAPGRRADLGVLVLANEDGLSGTLTMIPDGEGGLPADHLYPDEVRSLRARFEDRRFVEVALLAIEPRWRGTGAGLVLSVTMIRAARALGVTDILVQIHPDAEAHYRSVMLFERHGEVRQYRGLSERAATVLMHHDLSAFEARARHRFGEAPVLANPYHLISRHPFPHGDLSRTALDASRAARAEWLGAERDAAPLHPLGPTHG